MAARGLAREHLRLCGFDGDCEDGRLLLLEVLRGPGDGAAGPDTGHDHVDVAFRVVPDLRTRGLVVRVRVGRVHELAGDDGAGRGLAELVGLLDGALHALGAGREHDFGAVGGGELATLDRHGLGHHENHPVAALRGEHGKADAGVSAGGLDDGASGLERSVLLGGIEHGLGHAVLDGASGVGCLVLAENGCAAV